MCILQLNIRRQHFHKSLLSECFPFTFASNLTFVIRTGYEASGRNVGDFGGRQYDETNMEWSQTSNAHDVMDISQPVGVARENVPTIVEQRRGFSIHNMSEEGRRFLKGFVEGKVSSRNVPAEFLRRFGRACIWAADNLHANADGYTTEEADAEINPGFDSGSAIWIDSTFGGQDDFVGDRLCPPAHSRTSSPRRAELPSNPGPSSRQSAYLQERLTVQTDFPNSPSGSGVVRAVHSPPVHPNQFSAISRSGSSSPASRSPISAGSSLGEDLQHQSFPPSPVSSTSSMGETIICLWDKCTLTIEGSKPSHIAKHLREVHFRGTWHDHSRGMCMWDGCAFGQTLFHSSFGKHIASTHLRNTKVACEFCGRVYSRGDSMNRHIASHHPQAGMSMSFFSCECTV